MYFRSHVRLPRLGFFKRLPVAFVAVMAKPMPSAATIGSNVPRLRQMERMMIFTMIPIGRELGKLAVCFREGQSLPCIPFLPA